MKKSPVSNKLLGIIKEEYILTDGAGKWLIIAILANILPIVTSIAFVPFVSQITTSIILLFFWKRYILTSDKEKVMAIKNKEVSFTMKKIGYILLWITILIQFPFAWFPYVTQVTSTILLGIIYATMTSYKEKK
ncbi:MAG: hypothetical protein Q8R04_04530 [Nanoarchaeota archaeon]|nr:hypothetical protein [Nanoarchaeota archaeon]